MKKKRRPVDPSQTARLASARQDEALQQEAARDGVWHACFDGSAQGGAGRMGIGGVLYAPSGEIHELAQALPGQGCNNEAEFRAAAAVLAALAHHGAQRIHLWGDSDLVVQQLRGGQEGKALRLAAWRDEMLALARGFESVTVTWIPRHRNGRADGLAAAGLLRHAAQALRPVPCAGGSAGRG